MHDNTENIREFAESLWQYFVPKIEQKMSNNVRYYRAQVVTNNGDGTLTIQRPYDNAITVPCVDSMKGAEVGAQVTVMVFGGTALKNSIVVADGKVSKLGGETEVMIQDDEPTVDFKIWIDTNDNTYGDNTVSIAGGGTGATTSAGARRNLVVPQKPKLLWSGSLGYGSGSISVPGIQFYRVLIVTTNNSVPMLACSDDGKYFLCSGSLFHYWVEGQGLYQRGFTMALDSANEGAVKIEYGTWMDHNPSAVHSASQTTGIMLYRIYGLVRHDDVQG